MRVPIWLMPLLLLPLSAGLPALTAPEARGSIVIVGDEAFASENGVTEGSGSADDPFIIRDWRILTQGAHGILVRGTTKHLLIEDVSIVTDCDDWLACTRSAILLEDASNVQIRRIEYVGRGTVVEGISASNVTVEEQTWGLSVPSWLPESSVVIGADNVVDTGIRILGGRDWRIDRLAMKTGFYSIEADGVLNLTVENSSLETSVFAIASRGASNVELKNSTISKGAISIGQVTGLTIRDVVSRGGAILIYADEGRNEDVEICRTTVSDPGSWSLLYLNATDRIRIAASRFVGGGGSVFLDDDDVRIESSSFTNSQGAGILAQTSTRFSIHSSTIDLNDDGLLAAGSNVVAKENWWGHMSGPSGVGPGQGNSIQAWWGADVAYEPWKTTPPPAQAGVC